MRAVDTIRRKRDGHALTAEEIAHFVTGAVRGDWADYQVSALLMAIVLRGMSDEETAALTRAMVASGVRLDWGGLPAVDKHSTGGVGDKTSLVVAPLAAACGAVVPMMSGRGLGHTGGTLDKLEAIPGFRVRLTLDELRAAIDRIGCALISPTDEIAPADRTLYALRDVTSTVESLPLITASILSKKIAEGIGGLIMDVKCGTGAFMKTPAEARVLAESLVRVGKADGVRTRAVLTRMDAPLGRYVGNALEVIESIEILKGGGPSELRDLCLLLAAEMVVLAGIASLDEAMLRVRDALASGHAFEKLREIVIEQNGDPHALDDPSLLPAAPHREVLRAPRGGTFAGWEAGAVGRACVLLGAGRARAEHGVDPAVGVVVHAAAGDLVSRGDALLEIHYRDPARLAAAFAALDSAGLVVDGLVGVPPLVVEVIE